MRIGAGNDEAVKPLLGKLRPKRRQPRRALFGGGGGGEGLEHGVGAFGLRRHLDWCGKKSSDILTVNRNPIHGVNQEKYE
jgi:hypothetical protein